MKLLFASILLILSGGTVMANDIKVYLDNNEYILSVDDNKTARDVFERMPDEMVLQRYGGHEYTGTLPDVNDYDDEQTSKLGAGHVYCWMPGNAFVINYVDYDIAPYMSVHIGEFVDKSVCDLLQNANYEITISKGKAHE